MKRLADICDIQYGYAFDSKCFTEDSSYPQLVRIRDVKRGYSETYYSGNYPEEYILSEGDLAYRNGWRVQYSKMEMFRSITKSESL